MNKGNVLRGGKRGKNSPINLPLLDESFIKFVSSKNFIIFVRFYLVFYEVRTQLAIFSSTPVYRLSLDRLVK